MMVDNNIELKNKNKVMEASPSTTETTCVKTKEEHEPKTETTKINFTAGDFVASGSRQRLGKDVELPLSPEKNEKSNTSIESLYRSRDGSRWMDEKRKNLAAYEYLCHVAEAKEWLEKCIGEKLPSPSDLGPALQNGVVLAKLVRYFEPTWVRKIFEAPKLQFRHSDNIILFFEFSKRFNLPAVFHFETSDLYNLKNFPKVIYTIHAISRLLFKLGRAPRIGNLVGKIEFEDHEVNALHEDLLEHGITLPSFGNLDSSLAKEMGEELPEEKVIICQKAIRVFLQKRRLNALEMEIKDNHMGGLILAQRFARRLVEKKKLEAMKVYIAKNHPQEVIVIQRWFREMATKRKLNDIIQYYSDNDRLNQVFKVQRAIKIYLSDAKLARIIKKYENDNIQITKAQALLRGFLARKAYKSILADQKLLESDEHLTIPTLARVIGIFSDRESENTSLELEIANLQAKVVRLVRENGNFEEELSQKDMKIELLVRNRITITDLLKDTNKRSQKSKKSITSSLDQEQINATAIFRTRTGTNATRKLLECYQCLFYVLQTQPCYITRLVSFFCESSNEFPVQIIDTFVLSLFSYAQNPREEYLLLKLFESAIECEIESAKSSITSSLTSDKALKALLNGGTPILCELLRYFTKCPKEHAYLRTVFEEGVLKVLKFKSAIETDPLALHKLMIKEEESSTGIKSNKKYDITKDLALECPDLKARLKVNRNEIENISKEIFNSITNSIKKMPYGIRYIARYLRQTILSAFGDAEDANEKASRLVSQILFSRFMNPALVTPDSHDVTTQSVTPIARKNLTEVSKMLSSVCILGTMPKKIEGALSIPTTQDFAPSTWVITASSEFKLFLNEVCNVADPETQLHYDSFADASTLNFPKIIISPTEILRVHETLVKYRSQITDLMTSSNQKASNSAMFASSDVQKQIEFTLNGEFNGTKSLTQKESSEDDSSSDILNQILDQLGPVPNYDRQNKEPAVVFTLSPKFALSLNNSHQEKFNLRQLFAYVKQEVIKIIRIHGNCDSIEEMLKFKPTPADEKLYNFYNFKKINAIKSINLNEKNNIEEANSKEEEQNLKENQTKKDVSKSTLHLDSNDVEHISLEQENLSECAQILKEIEKNGSPLTLKESKEEIIKYLIILENNGIVSNSNGYADVMRSIGRDFRKRHKRAEEQRKQLASLFITLETLKKKQNFLKEQEESYDEYINACMQRLSLHQDAGGRKKRIIMPFGKQARHLREIEKITGEAPKFGSYKYSARDLIDRHVILSVNIQGVTQKMLDKIDIAISSTIQGVFDIIVTTSLVGVTIQCGKDTVLLEDLLQNDNDNIREMKMFDETVVANVQLLLGLINKKFYA